MIFYDFKKKKKTGNFQIWFLWLNLWFFDDEIYDLVSLDVEAKRVNHKILTKKNVTKSYKNAKQKHAWSSVHASFKDVQAAERRGQAHQRQTSSWSLGKAL